MKTITLKTALVILFTLIVPGLIGVALGGDDLVRMPAEEAVSCASMPAASLEEAQQRSEELVEQRQDTENNIGKKSVAEAVIYSAPVKIIIAGGTYTITNNERGLPVKIERPDGEVIQYQYSRDESGAISSVELSSSNPTAPVATITESGINVHSPEDTSKEIVITPEEGPVSFDAPSLINYGLINFRKIVSAFNELSNSKDRIKNKYSKKGNSKRKEATLPLASSTLPEVKQGDMEAAYKSEMQAAFDKFYKVATNELSKCGFSCVSIRGNSLKAVITLPEKK